ncbi:MAG: YlmC/YmxH family sporulation protein [Emergencia sp.]|jgi:YlmC/YmxH family sporulation protein|uniref:YlmC/YmxH family sporulation protein n=1 Tax=Anaerotruncus colihominis TaxID=169435 RepID=A0A845QJT8_9FIRM|nr:MULTISPECIES: YlmC/YmxH family sporulation protein [Clostridia]MCI5688325.1 YlmC/YmxH family sporulation protein [Emergencia sp.]MCI9475572.1 YlmC/YmxH family sporulation protein [Emergencia sp.]MCI9639708.1 YlmC/YmxH family sporulation protein [Emergencia sp.]NBH61023.1 YlmC/YmxH family sporulation protein [Anaerotruncus colihominis]NCE98545.1 YlmC/YmxH family sporulation protein [Emergencia sp. 1XD21-10]
MLSTDKLKNKEVINMRDGRSLGFIYDIEVNLEKGTIDGVIIPAERGLFRFFGNREDDFVIKWDRIRTIGDDVVLVDLEGY